MIVHFILKQSTEDDEIKQTIHSLLAYEGSHMAQMVRIHNTTQISLCVKTCQNNSVY